MGLLQAVTRVMGTMPTSAQARLPWHEEWGTQNRIHARPQWDSAVQEEFRWHAETSLSIGVLDSVYNGLDYYDGA
eukprot:g32000.t1